MRVDYAKLFIRQLRKCPPKIQLAFRKRLELFVINQFHPLLNCHSLHGRLAGYKSINVTGDWRALFREFEDRRLIYFEMIGTHSELYE